jgi:hypothetical protein
MIPEPDTLEEIGNVVLAELERLPIADFQRLIQRVCAAEDAARHYKQFLQSVLHRRFGEHAHQLRREAGKTTGMVRFHVDGHTIVADLPKKVDYDQRKLKDAVEALRKWGEDPEDYVSLEVKVAEAKYTSWPPAVRQLFEPARTLRAGKPTYRLERIAHGADEPEAANDSQFGEAL